MTTPQIAPKPLDGRIHNYNLPNFSGFGVSNVRSVFHSTESTSFLLYPESKPKNLGFCH